MKPILTILVIVQGTHEISVTNDSLGTHETNLTNPSDSVGTS